MKKLKFLFFTLKSPEFQRIFEYLTSKGLDFYFRQVDRKSQFRKALIEKEWDIVFVDDSLRSLDIGEALAFSADEAPAVPRIAFFEKITEENAVRAMCNGASDIIIKNRLTRLIPAIHNCLHEAIGQVPVAEAEKMLEKYDFMINTSRSFLTLIDRNYRYKAINDAFCAAHNLSKNEILGKTLAELWGKQKFREFIKPNLDKCFTNKEIRYKAWFETPTLGMRFFEVIYYPFANGKGDVTHTIVDTQDITEKKEMENKLIQSESKVVSIIENTKDYFWSLDKDMRIIYVNRLYQNTFEINYNNKLTPGSYILELLPPNERKVWKERYNRCLNGERFSFEQSYLSEGQIIYYDISLNPVFGDNNEISGISCLARDITDRKQNEEKVKNQAEDLSLINKLNIAANAGLSFQKIIGIISRETSRIFQGYGAVIYLLSEDGQTLFSKRKSPLPKKILNELEKLSGLNLGKLRINLKPGNHYANVLKSREPYLSDTPTRIQRVFEQFVENNSQRKLIAAGMKLLDLKAILTVPLFSEDQPIGVIDISKQTFFSEVEITRILGIAEQVTSVLKRKMDEEAIRESENKFRSLFEAANDAIFILENNIFITCNQKTLNLLRCKMNDVIGKTPFDFSPEKQPDGTSSEKLAKQKIQKAYKGDPVRFDWLHKRIDGSEFYTEVSLNLVKITGKSYLQAIVRDITIRKESEILLRESEERFRAIFEDAPDALLLADPESGYLLDLNQAATKLLKRSKAEIIGVHFSKIHPPEQKKLVHEVFFNLNWNKPLDMSEVIYVLQGSGEWVPVEIQGKLISFGGKKMIQGAFRNVADRLKAQQEIIQKEELLTETQRIAHLGSWEMELESGAVSWSDETYNILGYDKENTESTFANFISRVHPEDITQLRKKLQEAIESNRNYEHEYRIIRPDGEIRHIYSKAEIKNNISEGSKKLVGSIHDITEIKKVETALHSSEEKFRTIFMQGHFPMILIDPVNKSYQANKSFLKLFGYTEKELQEIDINDLTHKDDRERSKENFRKVVARETDILEMEKKYIKKDGSVLWGHTGGAPIKDEQGKVSHVILMVIDITKEKMAEQQIKERTEDLTFINNLNHFANQNPSLDSILKYFSKQINENFCKGFFALLIWDSKDHCFKFRFVSIQDHLRKIVRDSFQADLTKIQFQPLPDSTFKKKFNKHKPWLVKTREEVLQLINDLFTQYNDPALPDTIVDMLDIKSIINFPLITGSEILGIAFLFSSTLFEHALIRRLLGIAEQFTGILKRKLVEEEEAKLFTVVEQLTESVVITDTDGIIQYANPAFEIVSGYPREEVVGKTPGILKSGRQNNEFYKRLWDTILAGKNWNGKIINRKKDGELYEEKVNITPIKDEHDNIVNFVAVKRDITRESFLEAQLMQSQKLETIGTLAGGIAHDFNNILGTLIGYNDMVIEDLPEDSSVHEYMVHMKNTLNRAKSMVNKILTFSRKMEPERKMVDLSKLLEETMNLFRPSIPANIKIATFIGEKCPTLRVDPAQIQQVFMNFLTNASQALKETGGMIEVKLELIDNNEDLSTQFPILKSDQLLKFSVCDDGPGMPPKIKDRVFEPFFTTKAVGEGTGLGLSVVHGIITAHNGIVEVKSEPNKGTCFTVYLPSQQHNN